MTRALLLGGMWSNTSPQKVVAPLPWPHPPSSSPSLLLTHPWLHPPILHRAFSALPRASLTLPLPHPPSASPTLHLTHPPPHSPKVHWMKAKLMKNLHVLSFLVSLCQSMFCSLPRSANTEFIRGGVLHYIL